MSETSQLILSDARQYGDELNLNLWYPRNDDSTVKAFVIGLVDVRSADGIRVSYDFDRDGWKIEQASKFQWDADDKVCDPDWQEVAFVQAWAREEAIALPFRKRPLNYRLPGDLYHAVFDAVGTASMCWIPRPGDQVFDSSEAEMVAVNLCLKIAGEMDDLREQHYELLAVLKDLVERCEAGYDPHEELSLLVPAKAWIARAEGRAQ